MGKKWPGRRRNPYYSRLIKVARISSARRSDRSVVSSGIFRKVFWDAMSNSWRDRHVGSDGDHGNIATPLANRAGVSSSDKYLSDFFRGHSRFPRRKSNTLCCKGLMESRDDSHVDTIEAVIYS